MTREEAINIMKVIVHMLEEKYDTDRVEDAVEMAIKALEIEPCGDAISRQYLLDNCVMDKVIMPYVPINRIENAPSVNPVPCEDAISRQAVLDGLRTCYDTETKEYSDGSQWINYEDAVAGMENLPSVTPQPKIGKWQQDLDGTYLCSECGSGFKEQPTLMGKPMFLWCPLCGARMKGVKNE